MLLPAVSFLMGVVGYSVLGCVVLACLPTLRLTVLNLLFFVVGAFAGGVAFLFVYGQLVAAALLSDVAFYGMFPALLVGGGIGGYLLVRLKARLVG
jgi:hypothetical protein